MRGTCSGVVRMRSALASWFVCDCWSFCLSCVNGCSLLSCVKARSFCLSKSFCLSCVHMSMAAACVSLCTYFKIRCLTSHMHACTHLHPCNNRWQFEGRMAGFFITFVRIRLAFECRHTHIHTKATRAQRDLCVSPRTLARGCRGPI